MREFTLICIGAVIGWNMMQTYRRIKAEDARADDNCLVAILGVVALAWII